MSHVIIYKRKDITLDILIVDQEAWLTQKQLALLFNKGVSTINEHLANLKESSVIRDFRITGTDEKAYLVKHYNQSVIHYIKDKTRSKNGDYFLDWLAHQVDVKKSIKDPYSNLIHYVSKDGEVEFDVNLDEETVWLSQDQMARLFDRNQRTISEHIDNIFQEKELDKESVYRDFRYTGSDNKTYKVGHYNLDVAISVGYRVKSKRGAQFRMWATKVLREYMVNRKINSHQDIEKTLDIIMNRIESALKEPKVKIENSFNTHYIGSYEDKRSSDKKVVNPIYGNDYSYKKKIKNTDIKINDKKIKELEDAFQTLIDHTQDLTTKTLIEKYKEEIKEIEQKPQKKKLVTQFVQDCNNSHSPIRQAFSKANINPSLIQNICDKGEFLLSLIQVMGG